MNLNYFPGHKLIFFKTDLALGLHDFKGDKGHFRPVVLVRTNEACVPGSRLDRSMQGHSALGAVFDSCVVDVVFVIDRGAAVGNVVWNHADPSGIVKSCQCFKGKLNHASCIDRSRAIHLKYS